MPACATTMQACRCLVVSTQSRPVSRWNAVASRRPDARGQGGGCGDRLGVGRDDLAGKSLAAQPVLGHDQRVVERALRGDHLLNALQAG